MDEKKEMAKEIDIVFKKARETLATMNCTLSVFLANELFELGYRKSEHKEPAKEKVSKPKETLGLKTLEEVMKDFERTK